MFFALLDDTLVMDVTYIHRRRQLEDAIIAIDARSPTTTSGIALSHTGALSDTLRNALQSDWRCVQ